MSQAREVVDQYLALGPSPGWTRKLTADGWIDRRVRKLKRKPKKVRSKRKAQRQARKKNR